MADNKRWFKVWHTILTDPDFLDMSIEDIGRWVLLGALVSANGENGKINIGSGALSRLLRCPENYKLSLPNVIIETPQNSNGKIIVTFKNWNKYQLDSTGYDRQKKFRQQASVTVQEKIRQREDKEKKREEIKATEAPSLKPTEEQKKELSQLCIKVTAKYGTKFNPFAWIQSTISLRPEVHISALKSLLENNARSPWAYLSEFPDIQNQNLNEAEHIKESKKFKETMQIGNVLSALLKK